MLKSPSNPQLPPEAIKNDYEKLGADIGRLVAEKQAAYGDSFGKSGQVLKILSPDGIKPEQYDDALAVIRIIDKLFRVATDKTAFEENPFLDIAGYGILGTKKSSEPNHQNAVEKAIDNTK